MNYKFTKEAHKGVKTLLQRDLHGLSIKAQRASKLGNKDLESKYKEQCDLVFVMLDLVETTLFAEDNNKGQS